MKRCISISILIASLIVIFGLNCRADINHAKFQAQQAALPSLEGPNPFTLRQSWLKGSLDPAESKLVSQQLFSKNEYQFWFAVPDPDAEVLLNVYDKDGNLLEADHIQFYPKKNVKSVVFSPEKTGIYYLRLALEKDVTSPQEWALIYAYR